MLKELLEGHNIEVEEDLGEELNRTGFMREVHITYSTLVELFGEPITNRAGDGTTVEWHLRTEDGVVAIYDYNSGLIAPRNTRWNLGAHGMGPVYHILDAIDAVGGELQS